MRTTIAVILSVGTFVTVGTASDSAPGRHTRAQAERNIMAAHRVLDRWGAGLVNPRTRLPRNNVWVRCSGRAGATAAGYARFRCIIGYRRIRVSVRYHAKTKNAFELHDRRTYRV